MESKIPLKLLLQHQPKGDDGQHYRLTALIDADTVVKLLQSLAHGATSVSVKAEMPREDMDVHLEIMVPDAPVSQLTFTKHLQDNAWTTDHVTLVRG